MQKSNVETADQFNELVDEAIRELASDDISKGADCLEEIAQLWSRAGLPIDSFLNMRRYIINEAVSKTDKYFIEAKLEIAERKLREKRTGSNIILN